MRASVHNAYSGTVALSTKREAREIPPLSDGDRFRFWAKVERRGERDCWLWTSAAIPGGHGQITLGKRPDARPYYAHRISWTLAHGAIPQGMAVLHTCDVPLCVNPAHLFLGSQDDNMKDAARKGRLKIARKRNRGKQDEAVARYLAGGVTQDALAVEYGVHKLTIHRWLKPHHAPYSRQPAAVGCVRADRKQAS